MKNDEEFNQYVKLCNKNKKSLENLSDKLSTNRHFFSQ